MRLLLTVIASLLTLCAYTQKWEKVKNDPTLKNDFFQDQEFIEDSVWLNSGLDFYFGMPVLAQVKLEGDFSTIDTLNLCECYRRNDTITVQISLPVVCCYNLLMIKIAKGSFTTTHECSYDVSPSKVYMSPEKQKLTLNYMDYEDKHMLYGYVYFKGQGKYFDNGEWTKLTDEEKKEVFKNTAEGYFKCQVVRD